MESHDERGYKAFLMGVSCLAVFVVFCLFLRYLAAPKEQYNEIKLIDGSTILCRAVADHEFTDCEDGFTYRKDKVAGVKSTRR